SMFNSIPQRSLCNQLTFFAVRALPYHFTIQDAVCNPVVDRSTITPKFADSLLNNVRRDI
ncbi:MAG TPA: hypothetical protein VM656_14970, partial [Pyrinomonadaceae bacterium]|nr:hypothetical protein [Pyrinomonadaceae bacterium]